MTYEFGISLKTKDFQRFLQWGQSVKNLTKEDIDLSKKIEFIIEEMIEEDSIFDEEERKDNE